MTIRRSRAKVPSPADRQARADTRRARAAVRPGSRSKDARTGRARTLALPDLADLGLTPEQLEEETMTVAQAADLLDVSHQALDQSINRGALTAWRLNGIRRLMVADLGDSAQARRQLAQAADERHHRGWAEFHLANDACQGAGCLHWTHEDLAAPSADDVTMTEPSQ